jgi:hypothetical protein
MIDDPIEIVNGSGNVFRDFGYSDADARRAGPSRAPGSRTARSPASGKPSSAGLPLTG